MADKKCGMMPLYINDQECTIEEETTVKECFTEESTLDPCYTEMTQTKKDACCSTPTSLDYLREVIGSELEAINYYQKLLLEICDKKVQKLLCSIMNDEKNHVAHHLYLLARYDNIQSKEFIAAGWKNAGNRHNYERDGTFDANNRPQIMQYLLQHMLEKVEQCTINFMEENLDEEVIDCIFEHMTPQQKNFLEKNLCNQNILDMMCKEMKEEFIQHIMKGLPQQFICDLIEFVKECCEKHLEKLIEQHMNNNLPAAIFNQILHYCHNYITECIFLYVVDYILSYLEKEICSTECHESIIENSCYSSSEATEESEDCPTIEETTEETTSDFDTMDKYEKCPKGVSHSKCCTVSPAWLCLIRQAVVDELKAINQYRKYIEITPEKDIKESYCAAMNSEKEHVAEMIKLIRMCDPAQAEELAYYGWKTSHFF